MQTAEVSRPRADFTIEYKPNWGSYLVTCIDGELSTNYLVRDRQAFAQHRRCACMFLLLEAEAHHLIGWVDKLCASGGQTLSGLFTYCF